MTLVRTIARIGVAFYLILIAIPVIAASAPALANHGMVVSANAISSEIGMEALREGGSAVDAAVATSFARAVTPPAAGD